MSRNKFFVFVVACVLILTWVVPAVADQAAPTACRVVKPQASTVVAQIQRRCPVGWRWALRLRRCVKMTVRRCPPRYYWNVRLSRCVLRPMVRRCPPRYFWNVRLRRCVLKFRKCGPGRIWNPQLARCLVLRKLQCGPRHVWSIRLRRCVLRPMGGRRLGHDCGPLESWDPVQRRCVANPPPAPPVGGRFVPFGGALIPVR